MAATVTALGPGTVSIGSTPLDFSCEVIGAKITHEYEETTEQRTRLCGDAVPAQTTRADGFTAELENDLSAAGLYAYLQTHDMESVEFTFTPSTAAGATWTGNVVLRLPSEIGADEFGAPIASSIEWPAVGLLTFDADGAP
jgi:hypothetical protein